MKPYKNGKKDVPKKSQIKGNENRKQSTDRKNLIPIHWKIKGRPKKLNTNHKKLIEYNIEEVTNKRA